MNEHLIVFSGPSGAGKSSIIKDLMNGLYKDMLSLSVSTTTRDNRPNEVNEKDYYFISKDQFMKRAENGEFAENVERYGNYYGTERREIDRLFKLGKNIIFDIDYDGLTNLKKHYTNIISFFITTVNEDIIIDRLRKRGENENSISKRRKDFHDMLKLHKDYDHMILNDNLEFAVSDVMFYLTTKKILY